MARNSYAISLFVQVIWLSLTPCFSGFPCGENRSSDYDVRSAINTPLKQGVNEMIANGNFIAEQHAGN